MEEKEKVQIGFFVVGMDGKFGPKYLGDTFEPIDTLYPTEDTKYWENRGYNIVPVFVNVDDWLMIGFKIKNT